MILPLVPFCSTNVPEKVMPCFHTSFCSSPHYGIRWRPAGQAIESRSPESFVYRTAREAILGTKACLMRVLNGELIVSNEEKGTPSFPDRHRSGFFDDRCRGARAAEIRCRGRPVPGSLFCLSRRGVGRHCARYSVGGCGTPGRCFDRGAADEYSRRQSGGGNARLRGCPCAGPDPEPRHFHSRAAPGLHLRSLRRAGADRDTEWNPAKRSS